MSLRVIEIIAETIKRGWIEKICSKWPIFKGTHYLHIMKGNLEQRIFLTLLSKKKKKHLFSTIAWGDFAFSWQASCFGSYLNYLAANVRFWFMCYDHLSISTKNFISIFQILATSGNF